MTIWHQLKESLKLQKMQSLLNTTKMMGLMRNHLLKKVLKKRIMMKLMTMNTLLMMTKIPKLMIKIFKMSKMIKLNKILSNFKMMNLNSQRTPNKIIQLNQISQMPKENLINPRQIQTLKMMRSSLKQKERILKVFLKIKKDRKDFLQLAVHLHLLLQGRIPGQ